MRMLRRVRVPPVEPVTAHGVRYETYSGNFQRFNYERGVIAAVDPTTEEELWALLIYETKLDPRWEKDIQEVFITDLRLEDDDTKLVVVNQRGKTYVVDLATRTVEERA